MKNKKVKTISYRNEDINEIKTLVIITIVIVIVAVGLYFLTNVALEKKYGTEESEAVISYDVATVGMMFNRPYDEYYIFAYSADDENAGQYDTLFTNYLEKEEAVKIYFTDLSLGFNSFALKEEANTKPSNAKEVAINNVALILIKDGKVSKYYETITEIEKALS